MDETRSAFHIVDEKGVRGTLDLTIVPPQGSESKLVLVRFDDGSQVFADAQTFVERDDNEFVFPGSFAELIGQNQAAQYGAANFGDAAQIVVPLLEEQLKIARQKVLTGGVRVHKTVQERTETVDEPTLREEVEFERVPINQFVAAPPEIRREGDVMIVPLVEEVLVIEKKLVLREEIRIKTRRDTLHNPQEFVLRREEATLEQIEPDAAGERINASSAASDTRESGE
ncbi:MAG: YsnF/AvaK domain-containing protein [Acidobacteriota bacterium]|nr:YsnF/AvaK domain-containing protein [Acidobacteriota bacterium]